MNRRPRASSTRQYAIIADDLTGSLDTGLQFHKKGLTTYVPLNWSRPFFQGQALVLNTHSRNIPGEEAYLRVFKACKKFETKRLYKKIDSTMRGNVGKEVLAILDARKIARAIVVPTVPVMGRTVEKGILRVHGIPLLRTPYAQDPFHPIFTSRPQDLLARETGEPVGFIGLNSIRKGPSFLAGKIDSHPARILALDAVFQTDLRAIAAACDLLPEKVLPCGSVSLADELSIPLPLNKERTRKGSNGPILIISASRNPRTREQIVQARESFSFPLMEPDLHALTHPRLGRREIQRLGTQIPPLLTREKGLILTTTFQNHISGQEEAIPKALGRVAASVLKQNRLGGLVLTGGDLAMGIYTRLSATALRIEDEVSPGIPCSILADGPFADLRLVTKAGGFGEKDALVKIIQYLIGS
jgi:D-threonate/D-erythronate kinase